jgi:N-acetylmuramoyl-L-alanine amidase
VKRKIIIFGILSLIMLNPLLADRHGFVRKVVIDAGHGGRDPGAVGALSQEKDIVLAISLKLGQYIKENFNDVEVIYTRTTDELIPLHRRPQIANENKADLFISVHCNSVRSNRPFGTETFVMGLEKSKQNLEVAKKENASILYEENYEQNYHGYDPNSPESNIMFSMFQNHFLNQSLYMASLVQNQFRERAGRHDRGVKQDAFLVLYNITMPGILVEAGFLSNPQEERYLMSETGQTHIASAIFRAFRDYKTNQDKLAALQFQNQIAATSSPTPAAAPARTAPQQGSSSGRRTTTQQQPAQTPVVQTSSTTTETPVATQHQPATSSQTSAVSNDVNFRVQFATTTVQKPLDSPDFRGLQEVSFYFHDGLYKYTVGREKTLEAAARVQQKLHESGFKDAFIVAFNHNERITTAEAARLIRNEKK